MADDLGVGRGAASPLYIIRGLWFSLRGETVVNIGIIAQW